MRLSRGDLEAFWRAASAPVPVAIVGGGRWGRVWASAITAARGNAAGLTIIARENNSEVRRWAEATPAMRCLVVVDNIAAAIAPQPPRIAIIASRPRDHARDCMAALELGAHVLAEKPLARTATEGEAVVRAADASRRILGLGTEFAFHPGLQHFAARLTTVDRKHFRVALQWTDPEGEIRHGLGKRHHGEITILQDLLSHSISVFRVLRPHARFKLASHSLAPSGRSGNMRFRDQWRGEYSLSCDAAAPDRQRLLTVQSDGEDAKINFAEHPPALVGIGGRIRLPAGFRRLDSTLRLEFGAFVAQVEGEIASSPITSGLTEILDLQAALEASGPPAAQHSP